MNLENYTFYLCDFEALNANVGYKEWNEVTREGLEIAEMSGCAFLILSVKSANIDLIKCLEGAYNTGKDSALNN